MTVGRTLLLAVLIVATPLCGSAQFEGMPGMPGGMPRGFGVPPPQAGPPPVCRELISLRDETQKHGMAIQKANERKATVQDACTLFKTYLAAEAKFIKGLEDNSRTCGVPHDAIKQAKEGHAKAEQVGKQVCEAAARPPMRKDPWDALREQDKDNCRVCGETGDFWWTVPPPGQRW